jgi:hypothetical protein
MTIEHWLTIVAIIATSITTLAAPILAEFVKSRISQPKPNPEPNQPKNAIQRIGGWLSRVSYSPWLYLFLTVLNIGVLLWVLRQVAVPIKRDDVLAISLTVGSIYFCFIHIGISQESRNFSRMIEISLKSAKIVNSLRNQVKTMQEIGRDKES